MAFRSPLLASSTFNQSYSCHLPFLIHSIFSIQLSCNPNFKKVQRFCPLTQFPAIYGTMHPSPLIDLHIEKTNTPLGHTKKKKKTYTIQINKNISLISKKMPRKKDTYPLNIIEVLRKDNACSHN